MKSVLTWLEASAERLPDKICIADPERELSFAQLLASAKAAGTWIAARSSARQGVAFFLDKSALAFAGMLGAAYSGCFYSVLDITQPRPRILASLEAIQPACVVIDEKSAELASEVLAGCAWPIVTLEELVGAQADEALLAGRRARACDIDPLYVSFTSGSTGTPKGVVATHRSVIDWISTFTETFGLSEDDIHANQAPFDFDASVKDLYSMLAKGSRVQIVPREYFKTPAVLMDYVADSGATTLVWAVSAMCFVSIMKGFDYRVPTSVKCVLFSGEVMPPKQLRKWQQALPEATFVNLYGPTEVTCNCTYYVVDRAYADDEVIPAGKAFDNERVFLLDESDREVEGPGAVGEVCVAGSTLCSGYLGSHERTAKAFMQNPDNQRWLEPIYRTGDLARYNENGELVYISRKDFQIKHMGHRVELGDIEAAAVAVDGVARACCTFDAKRDKIHLFYVGEIDKDALASALRDNLPSFMVPSTIRQLEQMPLSNNGKIDRKALQAL